MSTVIEKIKHEPRLYSVDNLPERDGKPMAETPKHVQQIVDTLATLQEYYRDKAEMVVYGNILVYYLNELGTLKRVSPDIFAVRGVPREERRVFAVEKEGKAPEVVIEFTSKGTKNEDLGKKKRIYAWLNVKEYFLFDPCGEYLKPRLRGFNLVGGEYIPMVQPEVGLRLHSEVLGLDLVAEKDSMRLYKPGTGERLLTPREAEAARREAEAAYRKAEAARLEAETARLEAETARLEAEAARSEAETARLQAESARRRAEEKARRQAEARKTADAEAARLREEIVQLRKR